MVLGWFWGSLKGPYKVLIRTPDPLGSEPPRPPYSFFPRFSLSEAIRELFKAVFFQPERCSGGPGGAPGGAGDGPGQGPCGSLEFHVFP